MKKRWMILGLIAIIGAVAGWNIGIEAAPATGPRVGNLAPNFTLSDLNGRRVTLNNVIRDNRATVVNFWATWCPPCRAEIPELISFYRRYSGQRVALLAVNLQENPGEVRQFARRQGMNFPVLTDTNGTVGNLYQVYALPTTFIIDQRGRIRSKIEGGTTLANLENQIRPLLRNTSGR